MKRIAFVLLSSCAPVAPPQGRVIVPEPVSTPPSPVDAVAVIYANTAAFDADTGRVFLSRENGVDVIEVVTGKRERRIEAAHSDLAPAGPYLLAYRLRFPEVDVTVVDPVRRQAVGACSLELDAPKTAGTARLDAFGHGKGSFLKWESQPPPEPPRGAARTTAEMQAYAERFKDAYACGVLAVRVTPEGCSLMQAHYEDAGLESCETRKLPPRSMMPGAFRSVTMAVTPKTHGSVIEHRLVVSDAKGAEVWNEIVAREVIRPMPP